MTRTHLETSSLDDPDRHSLKFKGNGQPKRMVLWMCVGPVFCALPSKS